MEPVLGIDFGTSFTSAGALVGDRVHLIQDSGDSVIPSVVYIPDRGPFEVGRRALSRVLQDPRGVIRSIKRVLGTTPTSAHVKQFAAAAPFRVDTAGERVTLKLRSGDYAPEQVVAAVLTRARELAEQRFGGTIRRAVITTSAAPPDGYRAAIQRAAKLAHLEVCALVPEPIAGALAVGLHAEPAQRRLLICDFGGGTFDVSALVQNGLAFTAIAAEGDAFLGGDDLDHALAEGIASAIVRKCGYDMHKDAVRWAELLMRCEGAKRALSARSEVPFTMRDAYLEKGQSRDLDTRLDRAWAEARWQPLMERAQQTILNLLERCNWDMRDVDKIVLVGGCAFVPMFQRMVRSLASVDRLLISPAADVSVAQGAVLLTARFGDQPRMVPVLENESMYS